MSPTPPAGRFRASRPVVAGVAFGLVASVALARAFSVSCPEGSACVTLDELRRGAALPEALHLYDRDGVLFAEVGGPVRQALSREEIPDLLEDAFVAVEDRRFWDHGGVDGRGVVRAALRNLREGGRAEGASTIPMQLVRTLWAESLRGAHPWRRKLIEARLAPRLIRDLGHERVLTLYLNAIYLGNGVYGVERAAQYYFGVGVGSLSVGQIATLVGITRSPESYEPFGHPERALDVRNGVLRELMAAGLVTPEQAQEAASRSLGLTRTRPSGPMRPERSHLTAAVTRELRRISTRLAAQPGLRIRTAIDSRLQKEGEAALEAQLASIENGRYGLFLDGDSTAVLEGAGVALDATTGAVRAWVGGRDFSRSEFDRVEQSQRQVGSLIKPFLVAAAVERGYGVIDIVSADTVPIATEEGEWLPADHVTETALPLREALVRSSNRAAAHLGAALGTETVVRVAERAGLGEVPALPSSSLGAFEASLLEMTAAYAAFGNGGMRVVPYLIQRVEGADGEILWSRSEPKAESVIDAQAAFVVLDALQAVVDRGTGSAVRSAGFRGAAAGKTGTTNDGRDAWFIGLTPDVAAGVWIGFDQPREIVAGRGGSALAAPVWGTWMRKSPPPRDGDGAGWIPPAGVELVRYDPSTGEVLDGGCTRFLRADFPEAWVVSGSYQPRTCRGGLRGWLDGIWRGIAPRGIEPLRPLIRSSR